MRLWIDDVREPPDSDWVWAKSSAVALSILAMAIRAPNMLSLDCVSFDHDLGGADTAMPVARWVEEAAYRGELPRFAWHIHSANPVGRKNLTAALQSAERYWDGRA